AINAPSPLIQDHDIARHAHIAVEGLSAGLAAAGLQPVVTDAGERVTRMRENGVDRVVSDADRASDARALESRAEPVSDSAEADPASSSEAAYRLEPKLEVRGRRVTLVATVYQTEDDAYVAGGVAQGLADVSLVETARDLADELAPRIRSAAEIRAAGEPPQLPETLVNLVFTGPEEDVRLILGDNLDIGRIRDGTVRAPFFPVPVGSIVEVRAQKAGRYPQQFEVEVEATEMEVEVPELVRHRRWEASARYRPQHLVAAGAGVRYYVDPGERFVAANSVLGVRPDSSGGPPSFYDLEADLRVGTYLFLPVTSLVRTGVSLGGGTRVTLIAPTSEASADTPAQSLVDPFATIGSAFIELNSDRFSPFLEVDLQYGFDSPESFLEPGLRGYLTAGVFFR
ncbi:MAG: hypothetical protein ACOCRN_02265, partial [Spirochaetia bacterium]